uniref:BPL/LPL catalytic domain-containing protein n=1 Tax=Prasinoderma coloniale TaxID=156133 RepID=A0A7R9TMS1_9VIRI|eukprot:PRCOL_00005327-RA
MGGAGAPAQESGVDEVCTAAVAPAALERARVAYAAAAGSAEGSLRVERKGAAGKAASLSSAGGDASAEDVAAARVHVSFGSSGQAGGCEFDTSAYFATLQQSGDGAPRIGAVCHYAAVVPSTQPIIYNNMGAFVDGAVVVADVQRSGVGRGGNAWTSPRGCLCATFVTEWHDGATLPHVQYVISLAVIRALRTLTSRDLGVRIKWPNDLYAGKHKIGGVLCQSTYAGGTFRVAIGFGVNVSNEEPTTCVNALLREATGGESDAPLLSREALLAATLREYESLEARMRERGFQALEDEYTASWLHTNQRVTLLEAGSSLRMVIKGLTPGGYLLAEDASGERYELHPDGNSLDFFQGLVRKKFYR